MTVKADSLLSYLDDPSITAGRRALIQRKPFLRQIYHEWYGMLAEHVPQGEGHVLELGSGAGFLDQYIPGLITSEIMFVPGVRAILDGCQLPFRDKSLRAITMTDVLHHLPDSPRFLSESARCVRSGGALIMVEPWNTRWARFVWTNFHHEPFLVSREQWELPPGVPLSNANGALPWIIFVRDRARFMRDFPQWKVERIEPIMPICYLLSGGFTLPSLQPGFSYPIWRGVEGLMNSFRNQLGMFAMIVVRRV